jgi:SNF2 family DNA or RNA helicase
MNMFMEELENLGHRTMSHPPGMTVRLFDYQLHNVRFMLDQERLPGGIHSHLFAPVVTTQGKTIWYSPIMNAFRKTAPPRVCGGILADDQGLGKTATVLGLILCNPAPPKFLHENGAQGGFTAASLTDGGPTAPSSSSSLSTSSSSTVSPLIRSRATLVVCDASRVEQWYNECVSKLKADHLSVSRYYGSDRTRNPSALADHDIVVTTFEVLTSDKLAASSAAQTDEDPAAKLHWWRIVVDDSHIIKDQSSFVNQACTELTSGRRWCVSGTPVTNKLEDLIGQFRFLHLSPLDNPASFAALSSHSFKLLALLRRILIRHSKSQRILCSSIAGETSGVLEEQPLFPPGSMIINKASSSSACESSSSSSTPWFSLAEELGGRSMSHQPLSLFRRRLGKVHP